MQLQSDKSHRLDEIKTQFRAREGYYRLMNSPDYSQRSQRAMGFSTGTANSNSSASQHEKTCIKISLVTINENDDDEDDDDDGSGVGRNRDPHDRNESDGNNNNSGNDINNHQDMIQRRRQAHRRSRGARDMKICFNVGRELFVYNYDGVRTGPDASNPIYKRFYKGSAPTCHDFNQTTASLGSICLLVGFSHGQVQLIDLNGGDEQESCKEFNVDRLIDKTRVTCIKWLPNSSGLFLVAHASGQMYLYKDDLPCGPTAPVYQIYKQSEGLVVCTCKTKTTRNPIYRWSMGSSHYSDTGSNSSSSAGSSCSLNKTDSESCSLNEFVFSPCAKYLACVFQDGFLRVYCYDTMELVGRARSYYGGLTCVCWSPDGKYVVTGGEDDLITVWSFVERRVVARGMGHKSWVSVVSFDSFYSGHDLKVSDVDNDYDDEDEVDDLEDEDVDDDDEEMRANNRLRAIGLIADPKSTSNRSSHLFNNKQNNNNSACSNLSSASHGQRSPKSTSYRFGSVGQDTQLCLWDLSDDLLLQPISKSRITSMPGASSLVNIAATSSALQMNSEANMKTPASKMDEKTPSTSTIANAQTAGQTNSSSSAPTTKSSSFSKTFSLVGKRDKRNFSSKANDKNVALKSNSALANGDAFVEDPTKLLGSPICPRMNEVPLIEPSVCKKISLERLTSLIFCQGGFITSCQDGYVFSWARPSRKMARTSPGQSNEELRVIDVGTSSAV